ncbi:MarR family winged helix-turn-helix transcriptional regulator [Chitinasiproducens palmae]|uniref:DNA-binding transcriptional regulator, MarR family n=1 Tax=Chitinasiproducens palmae TaxID=1770053 RepID=A0A1H2PQ63_9BURK|nr:MarR family transcriptional regulator [Chitinasiproducens palmae]SDV48501.1 DNA-binding transcriptional regulator, MarR family [Chitinasiproducens palmae]
MSEGVYGDEITGRITHGLLRLSTAMRSQAWSWAEGAGLTPTQGEILVLLMQSKTPLRLGEIARQTALTAATASDAVTTLESKGLVEKRRAVDDGRALAVRLTARGRTAAKKAATWPKFVSSAAGTLATEEQASLYRSLLKLIFEMEERTHIPKHRMCLTCEHFEPLAEAPKGGRASARRQARAVSAVHHCDYFVIDYSDNGIRLDCPGYEPADVAKVKKIWKIFNRAA